MRNETMLERERKRERAGEGLPGTQGHPWKVVFVYGESLCKSRVREQDWWLGLA